MTIAFVQTCNGDPGATAQTSVTCTFASAQNVGDLVVLTIGWASQASNTETISSIADTKGNAYTAVAAILRHAGNFDSPDVGGSMVMYYAKNIKAATASSNTITVNFSSAVDFPTIIAAEYSGADTVAPFVPAVLASATGNSTSAAPGTVTLSYAAMVLVAGEYQARSCTAAGGGFTSRVITSNDEVCLADKIVNSAGGGTTAAPTFTLTSGTNEGWLSIVAGFAAENTLFDDAATQRPIRHPASGGEGVEVLARITGGGALTSLGWLDAAPPPSYRANAARALDEQWTLKPFKLGAVSIGFADDSLPPRSLWKKPVPVQDGGGGGAIPIGAGPWLDDVQTPRTRKPITFDEAVPLGATATVRSAGVLQDDARPPARRARSQDDAAAFDATKPLPNLFAEEPPVVRGKPWQASAVAAADQASAFSATKPLPTLFSEEPPVRGTTSKAAQVAAFDQAAAFSPTKPNLGTSVGPFGDDPPRAWVRAKFPDDAFVPKTLATVALPSLGWLEEPARVGASTPRQRLFAYTAPEQVLDDVSLATLSKFGYGFDEARGRWKRPAVFDEAVPLGATKPLLSVGALQEDARPRVVVRVSADDAPAPSGGRRAIPWGDEPNRPSASYRPRPSDEIVLSGHATSLPFTDDGPRRPTTRQAPDDALPFRALVSAALPSIGWNEEPLRVGARTPPGRALLAQESAQIFESVHVVVLPTLGWMEPDGSLPARRKMIGYQPNLDEVVIWPLLAGLTYLIVITIDPTEVVGATLDPTTIA